MSLLDDFGAKCVLLDKKRTPDGEGGYTTVWSDGIEFLNYSALDNSMQARVAEAQGVKSVYTVLVKKDIPLEFGDFYRDTKTGATYCVTSHPDEKQAPKSASPMLRELKSFTAERKDLPK